MRRRLKIVVALACVVAGIPLTFVAIEISGIAYDVHRVYSMCAKLVPGTPLPEVRRIVTAAGVGQLLPPEVGPDALGSYDDTVKNWFFSIPVAMEYGDERCAIYNDGHVVIKAEMELL